MTHSHDDPIKQMEERAIPRPDITVAQIILLTLSRVGAASFREVMMSPAIKLLGDPRTENSFYTALARLKRRRYIVRTAARKYELTPIGEYAALKAYVRKEFTEQERKLKAHSTEAGQSVKWDGRWRLVLFDIPESKRALRDYVRTVLKRVGCREFQRSMWIYPHKLPAFVSKMLEDPQMRRYAKVITTYDIDYDEDLRRLFRLA